MRILVTGGTGLVGSYLQKSVDAVYICSKDFDLTKETEVERMYKEHRPEVVIHLAAKVGGIMDNISKPFEYYEENLLMNTFVVKYARLNAVKKFVGVLSSCIYPDVCEKYPMKETDLHLNLPNENNFGYGYAKRVLGVHIEIAKKAGLNYSYVIPSNLYGEYESGDSMSKHFVGALLDKIAFAKKNNQDRIQLFGDGSPLRQFTFAKDVADILKLVVEHDVQENINVSTEENLSIDRLARLALEATDSGHLRIDYDSSKPNGQYRKDVSIDTFKKLFPNYKFTPYIEGVKKTFYAIHKNHG